MNPVQPLFGRNNRQRMLIELYRYRRVLQDCNFASGPGDKLHPASLHFAMQMGYSIQAICQSPE